MYLSTARDFQRPSFWINSVLMPLEAKSEARPIRNECDVYVCIGKPKLRMDFVNTPLIWLRVKGEPFWWTRRYGAPGGRKCKYCLTATKQHKDGSLSAGIRSEVGGQFDLF